VRPLLSTKCLWDSSLGRYSVCFSMVCSMVLVPLAVRRLTRPDDFHIDCMRQSLETDDFMDCSIDWTGANLVNGLAIPIQVMIDERAPRE